MFPNRSLYNYVITTGQSYWEYHRHAKERVLRTQCFSGSVRHVTEAISVSISGSRSSRKSVFESRQLPTQVVVAECTSSRRDSL